MAHDHSSVAKGWTCPKEVDGHKVEDFWRAHQIPVPDVKSNPSHLQIVEQWMRSYEPQNLFDDRGTLVAELRGLPPTGDRRMSANPHANGENSESLLTYRTSGVMPSPLIDPE